MTKKIWLILTILLWLMGFIGTTQAQIEQTMTVDEIQPGMTAVGKSVFHGAEIEEFELEILGILRNIFNPQKDVIIARATDDFIKHTGIMSGMSGSPIYVDDKLIGALAYGWGFMKEPIFGITPVADLIEIFKYPDLAEESDFSSFPSFNEFTERYTSNKTSRKKNQEIPIRNVDRNAYPELAKLEGQRMTLLQSPLVCTGFDPEAMQMITNFFQHTNFTPMQGGGNSPYYDTSNIKLEAGSAMGIQLVGGDFNVSATGTVTFRDGNRIAAFGHSMFSAGHVKLPMTNAYLITPMPSLLSSWKLTVAGDLVGTITQDRQTGVAGNIGAVPEMIPLNIDIELPETGRSNTYQCQMLDYKPITPLLTLITISSAIRSFASNGEYAIDAELSIGLEKHPDIKLQDTFSGSSGGGFDLGLFAAQPLNALMNNQFDAVQIKHVNLKITYRPEEEIADITSLRVDRTQVRPGEMVEITAFLQPHRGDAFIESYQVPIPADMDEGVLIVTACDAISTQDIEMQRAPLLYQPKNLDHLIEILQMRENSHGVIIELFRVELGATIQGQELPAIPPSMIAVLSGTRQTGEGGINLATRLTKHVIPTDYRVQGCEFLQVEVSLRAKP